MRLKCPLGHKVEQDFNSDSLSQMGHDYVYIGTIVREACFEQVLFISTLVTSPFDSKGFASREGWGFFTIVYLSFRIIIDGGEGIFLRAILLILLANSLKYVYNVVYVVKLLHLK